MPSSSCTDFTSNMSLRICSFRPNSVLLTFVRHHTGYIPFEGRLPNTMTPRKKFYLDCLDINLQPCKKITFTIDPFVKNVAGVRDVMHIMSAERVRKSNPKCIVKSDVVDDRSEPTIKVELAGDHDGKKIVFEAGLLTAHEIVFQFNRLTLPLIKEEVAVVLESKGEKMRKKGK
jgi:hypothetical protein